MLSEILAFVWYFSRERLIHDTLKRVKGDQVGRQKAKVKQKQKQTTWPTIITIFIRILKYACLIFFFANTHLK